MGDKKREIRKETAMEIFSSLTLNSVGAPLKKKKNNTAVNSDG
jgi:hypothetical protein